MYVENASLFKSHEEKVNILSNVAGSRRQLIFLASSGSTLLMAKKSDENIYKLIL